MRDHSNKGVLYSWSHHKIIYEVFAVKTYEKKEVFAYNKSFLCSDMPNFFLTVVALYSIHGSFM